MKNIKKKDMFLGQFAVIDVVPFGNYSFTVLHCTRHLAEQEAERLCRKHQRDFGVIQIISRCHPKEIPLKWTRSKESKVLGRG